jgi:hypothetical protein
MWGYPVPVLGAISPFLEPFRGRLSPNIDNVSEQLTLRYPHDGPWVVLRTEYLCTVVLRGCWGDAAPDERDTSEPRGKHSKVLKTWTLQP